MAITYKFTTSIDDTIGSTVMGKGMLTQAVVDANYPLADILFGKVTLSGEGWQKFIVPYSGVYSFTIVGASGGNVGNRNPGGKGAKITGKIFLQRKDVLYILVGQVGWCNPSFVDWGGGGGGGTFVLRANPSGAFTYAKDNVKVDVLLVAGGGGGAGDNPVGTSAPGTTLNAKYDNGTVTTAGVSSVAVAGAGLLSGASGSGPASVAVLTGNGNTNIAHAGGFGGGGGSYNGGGGGGGYSGGAAADNRGGYGGTSWIDGSATNVTRAWDTGVSHGYLNLALDRDVNKKVLILDSEGYKYFNSESQEWELMRQSDPFSEPTYADYNTYGGNNITNMTGLIKENVKVLVRSTEANESIMITGILSTKTILPKFELDISDVRTINKVTAVQTGVGGTVKFAVSTDHGTTYKTLINNIWENISVADQEDFWNNGIDYATLGTIAKDTWGLLNARNIRFAICIKQTNSGPTYNLASISLNLDLIGSWRRARHGTDYDYEYITSDQLKVTIITSGDYKINYLDRI